MSEQGKQGEDHLTPPPADNAMSRRARDWLMREARLPARVTRNEERVRNRFWRKLRRVMSRIPFAQELLAAYYAATDPATPREARAMLLAALAYFVLPLDFLPDFILGVGFTDDATVLLLALKTVRDSITPAHRARARDTLERLRAEAD